MDKVTKIKNDKHLFEMGYQLTKEGKIQEAINFYNQAIEENPTVIEYYLHLAKALTKQEQYKQAIISCKKAIELNPNEAFIHYELGEIFTKEKEYNDAIFSFKQATELNPNIAKYHHRLGEVLQRQNHLDEAILSYRRAIELEESNFRSHLNLGIVLAKQAQYSEAISCYRKAIELNPNFAMAYHHLGDALTRKKGHAEAISCFKKAIELNPNLAIAYHRLGDVLQNKGHLDEAINYYRKAIDLNASNFWSYYNLGAALTKNNQHNEAIKFYQKAIEINPNFAEAYCNLGYALTYQGKINEAITNYQMSSRQYVLASNPNFVNQYWDTAQVKGPDFMVIGSMKAGTTSLYEYISQHPHFLPCIQKEIDFFSIRYDKGIDWYLAHFPPIPDETSFFTGEASTSYIDYPEVEKRVFNHFPKTKIIMILRNPIDRAFSHYNHILKYHPGKELRSFEEAVFEEMNILKRLSNPALQAYSHTDDPYGHLRYGYLLRGLYVYFIRKWMDLFPKEQILILQSENFYGNPGNVMKQVFNFLEFPEYQQANYPKYNEGSYSSINQDLRCILSGFFKDHNKFLENLLDLNLKW